MKKQKKENKPKNIIGKVVAATAGLATLSVVASYKVTESQKHTQTLALNKSKFVNVSDVVPEALIELRYYTAYNFVGQKINGYLSPIAILTNEAASALASANKEFLSRGYTIKIFDAYRPVKAVKQFCEWQHSANNKMKNTFYPLLNKKEIFDREYIAKKSTHSRGSAIDLTLVNIKTGKELDMGSCFDYFGPISHPGAKEGLSQEQLINRYTLANVMMSCGFKPMDNEWWHFTLKNEPYPNTYFDFDVSENSLV
ncbi:MAG: M15 family metallopeptidase [Coriobacteriales bacterium]|nr:M15 family metallopeptidase [Coriobacteriales bacterium]